VPLLHTWSLSMEEQLYLAWPALLIGLGLISARLGMAFRRIVLCALMAILAASFVWGWGASLGEGRTAQADFYLIFSRAWELAIGALLALAAPDLAARSRACGGALCLAGLLLIAWAITSYEPTMRGHGPAAAGRL
jgi:peptidoglycan/LPS O-acetylase OafA/YrhL